MTDRLEQVARRAAGGDGQAFEALCRALQDDIWRYCYALTDDRELAFEAAQETFLRAVTAIRGFRGQAPVRVWLLTLARRAVAGVLARKDREQRADRAARRSLVAVASPAETGVLEVSQLIAALSPELRQAFVLTQLLGLSYEQAAAVMDCPTGTIRSRVYRARERLVTALTAGDAEQLDAGGADAGR